MTEQNKLQQGELTDQLTDLTETMQRENIKFSPEMQKYFDETLARITDKMEKGQMPTRSELYEFKNKIKIWILVQPLLPVITKLKVRFEENKYLHEGVEWGKIEESLIENPDALWSINEMEETGHEPDVYNADNEGFDIGTCSKESPEKQRNCTHDESVEMAEAMRIELMNPIKYKSILQAKGEFDNETTVWLKVSDYIRDFGLATYGGRFMGVVSVGQDSANNHNDLMGWRGSLRVPWKK